MAAAPAYRLCQVGKNLLKKQQPQTYPQWKIDLCDKIRNVFHNNAKVLIFQHNSLTSNEWSDLRYHMEQENMRVKFFPNKITGVALKHSDYANIAGLFRCYTAVAYGNDINLKSVLQIMNKQTKIILLGAVIDNTLMNIQHVSDYANLPSLEDSRAELLQILSQPVENLSRLLQANQTNLSTSLELYADGSK